MEEITIKYWSPHGRQEETKFQSDHTKVDFVMRAAQRVDLSDLSRCHKLMKLDLSHNMLEDLNLSPLATCMTLNESAFIFAPVKDKSISKPLTL